MATAGVDFFRVDRSGATRRLLVIAGAMVMGGATSIGAHLVSRLTADVAQTISFVGGLVVIGGLILGFGAMAMLLFENVYLLIREEGLLLHDNGKETRIDWGDLDATAVEDAAGILVLHRKGAEPVRWRTGDVVPAARGRTAGRW